MTRFAKYPENRSRDAAAVVLVSIVLPLILLWLYLRETISTFGFVALLACGVVTLLGLFAWLVRKSSVAAEVVPGKAAGAKPWDGPPREFRPESLHYASALLTSALLLGYFLLLAEMLVSGRGSFRNAGDFFGMIAVGVVGVLIVLLNWSNVKRLSLGPESLDVSYPLLGRSRGRSLRYADLDTVESSTTRYGWQVRIKPAGGSPVTFYTSRSDVADDLLDALRQRVAASKPAMSDGL